MVALAGVVAAKRKTDYGSISNEEATRFACGLDVRHVGRREIVENSEYSMVLSLNRWQMGRGYSMRWKHKGDSELGTSLSLRPGSCAVGEWSVCCVWQRHWTLPRRCQQHLPPPITTAVNVSRHGHMPPL